MFCRSPSDSAFFCLSILRQRRFRVADLLFLLRDFLVQPAQVLLIRRETKFQVLRRVFLGKRIRRERGELRIRRLVDDLDQPGLRFRRDSHAAEELTDDAGLRRFFIRHSAARPAASPAHGAAAIAPSALTLRRASEIIVPMP